MAVSYDYAIASFPGLRFLSDQLNAEIEAAAIGVSPTYSSFEDDVCRIYAAEALDTGQKAALDAVVAAHVPAVTGYKFHASSKYVELEKDVTLTDWAAVGGAVTNPGFFMQDRARAVARSTGGYQVSGGDLELRFVEADDLGVEVIMSAVPWVCVDSSGAWKNFQFSTNLPPRAGENLYRLDARLINGATSAKIRFVSATILELNP